MKLLRTIAEVRAWRRALPAGSTVGFVPTMGALHAGHLSLIHLSRAQTTHTISSLFVNPLQFGPKEDLARYPRPFERDREQLEHEGCDALFAPEPSELYRDDASTYVVEEKVSLPLCGEFRPGHFRGVATVVLKLFNITQPDVAYFGQKDHQQCAVIERMIRDLDVPVRIVHGETVREIDGLAMSSRNVYLGAEQRKMAPLIYRGLEAARDAWIKGERETRKLEAIGRSGLEAEPAFRIQYWEARHPVTLERLERVGEDGAVFAVAAYLGTTRLIDNLRIG